MVVKVGGMCWVISTGARSSTPPSCATMALSACGPPVEEPISSTRGGVAGIGRSTERLGGVDSARSLGRQRGRRLAGRGARRAPGAMPQALRAQPELADFLDQVAAETAASR